MQLATHDFKSGLSGYLAAVQAGATIEITSHKRPIARVIPIPQQIGRRMDDLIRAGLITWGGQPKQHHTPVDLMREGKLASQMVIEDRG
jgi:prevent-host-death family protein